MEWFAARPAVLAESPLHELVAGSQDAVAAAVRHVSGMTDRYAFAMAVEHLGWEPAKLPRGA